MPANFEADPEGVIHLAFSIKINQKKMKKLEKEYTTMKTKEKEDEIELRVSQCPKYIFKHSSHRSRFTVCSRHRCILEGKTYVGHFAEITHRESIIKATSRPSRTGV